MSYPKHIISAAGLALILSSCASVGAPRFYSVVYDGDKSAKLPTVNSLEECTTAIRSYSAPEARAKLTFKDDPLDKPLTEDQIGRCSTMDVYYIISADDAVKINLPRILKER